MRNNSEDSLIFQASCNYILFLFQRFSLNYIRTFVYNGEKLAALFAFLADNTNLNN